MDVATPNKRPEFATKARVANVCRTRPTGARERAEFLGSRWWQVFQEEARNGCNVFRMHK
jgi:hypothetical protein